MYTFLVVLLLTLNTRKMFNKKDIELALTDINTELKPNTLVIAKK
jgi:hypothetical protein